MFTSDCPSRWCSTTARIPGATCGSRCSGRERLPARPRTEASMAISDKYIEKRCVISGVGQSDVARRLGRDPLELTLDACLAAIADAGLEPKDIDGLSTYPGAAAPARGFSGGGAYDVIDALRLHVGWDGGGLETSGQLGSVIKACLAVGAGLCDHAVCFRSVWEGTAQGAGGRAAVGMGSESASGPYYAT